MKNHRSFFIQEQTTKSFVAAKVNYFLVVYSVINYSETKFNQLLLSIVSYIQSKCCRVGQAAVVKEI